MVRLFVSPSSFILVVHLFMLFMLVSFHTLFLCLPSYFFLSARSFVAYPDFFFSFFSFMRLFATQVGAFLRTRVSISVVFMLSLCCLYVVVVVAFDHGGMDQVRNLDAFYGYHRKIEMSV